LGFSEEEKGPQMEKLEKFIYSTFCILIKPNKFGLVKFFQKCTVWEIASLAKNSKSGKRGEKGQSCHFHIVVVFYWNIRLTI
jgi:hypothetical protein